MLQSQRRSFDEQPGGQCKGGGKPRHFKGVSVSAFEQQIHHRHVVEVNPIAQVVLEGNGFGVGGRDDEHGQCHSLNGIHKVSTRSKSCDVSSKSHDEINAYPQGQTTFQISVDESHVLLQQHAHQEHVEVDRECDSHEFLRERLAPIGVQTIDDRTHEDGEYQTACGFDREVNERDSQVELELYGNCPQAAVKYSNTKVSQERRVVELHKGCLSDYPATGMGERNSPHAGDRYGHGETHPKAGEYPQRSVYGVRTQATSLVALGYEVSRDHEEHGNTWNGFQHRGMHIEEVGECVTGCDLNGRDEAQQIEVVVPPHGQSVAQGKK